jgi:hypothetical protein
VIENAQQEMFPLVSKEGTTPSDEEDFDLVRVKKTKKGITDTAFPVDEVVAMAIVHKRLRFGYNGDVGTEADWVHKEALTPIMANRFHVLTSDTKVEILSALAPEEPSVLQISSSEDMTTDTKPEREMDTSVVSAASARRALAKSIGTHSISNYLPFSNLSDDHLRVVFDEVGVSLGSTERDREINLRKLKKLGTESLRRVLVEALHTIDDDPEKSFKTLVPTSSCQGPDSFS